jgi:ethanolamine ammonia-lyase small subunit
VTVPEPKGQDNLLAAVRACTPARIFLDRAGPAYRTATQLELRQDHAAAVDAVHQELDVEKLRVPEAIDLFDVQSCAGSKVEYLRRPDLGRRLNEAGRNTIAAFCPRGADLQIFIGDGLSPAAVNAQVPVLLLLLVEAGKAQGWSIGRPFAVRYCRVGVLNDVGDTLEPKVAVLLIGERPGLATAESLSAYLAYRPHSGQTDADRNLISNIHTRGVLPEAAAMRIIALAEQMRLKQTSGVTIKEKCQSLMLPAREQLTTRG